MPVRVGGTAPHSDPSMHRPLARAFAGEEATLHPVGFTGGDERLLVDVAHVSLQCRHVLTAGDDFDDVHDPIAAFTDHFGDTKTFRS